jgi:hypothetical protein
LGIQYQFIESDTFAEYLNLRDDDGIYVTKVDKFCDSTIKEGDVILQIDGRTIFGDGTVSWKKNRISFDHFVKMRFVGDKINLKVFREGKYSTIEVLLRHGPIFFLTLFLLFFLFFFYFFYLNFFIFFLFFLFKFFYYFLFFFSSFFGD